MRILYVTQSLGKGGAERLVLDIANALKSNYPSVSVKIVPLGPANDYPEMCNGIDIQLCNSHILLSIKGKSKIDIDDFEQIVNEFQPDVIHSHTYVAELVSREHIRDNISYFTHVHSNFPEFDRLENSSIFNKTKLVRLWERNRILKRYKKANNHFITISRAIDGHLHKQLSKAWSKNIHLIPNGINFIKFSGDVKAPNKKECIQLISVGRLTPIKNQAYLIQVINELKLISPDVCWKLNILGVGPDKSALETQIEKLNLNEDVKLVGLVSNVEDWLRESHIYLHSAISEPFGLAIAEAMAASLPVVALHSEGPADIIKNNYDGFLLPQTTKPKEFAQYILDLINRNDFYKEMAKNAHESARKYDINNYVKLLLHLYNESIASRKSL